MKAWGNSNEKNIENVRELIEHDAMTLEPFGMVTAEYHKQPTKIKITKESRRIVAKHICRLK